MPIIHTENGTPSSKSRIGADGRIFDDVVRVEVEDTLVLKTETFSGGANSIYTFTVPADKQWILKGGTLVTDSAKSLEIRIRTPPSIYEVILDNIASATQLIYKPSIDLRLPSGSVVVFETGSSGGFGANVLVEEKDVY